MAKDKQIPEDAPEEAVADDLPPIVASYVTVPDVNSVEMGRPDGTLCRIEAGVVHHERDPRMVGELDRHWALERLY